MESNAAVKPQRVSVIKKVEKMDSTESSKESVESGKGVKVKANLQIYFRSDSHFVYWSSYRCGSFRSIKSCQVSWREGQCHPYLGHPYPSSSALLNSSAQLSRLHPVTSRVWWWRWSIRAIRQAWSTNASGIWRRQLWWNPCCMLCIFQAWCQLDSAMPAGKTEPSSSTATMRCLSSGSAVLWGMCARRGPTRSWQLSTRTGKSR